MERPIYQLLIEARDMEREAQRLAERALNLAYQAQQRRVEARQLLRHTLLARSCIDD